MAKAAGMEFIPASQLKKEQASSISNEEVNDSKETDSSSEGEEPEFTIYRKDDANEEVYVGPIDSASSGEEYDYVEGIYTLKFLLAFIHVIIAVSCCFYCYTCMFY